MGPISSIEAAHIRSKTSFKKFKNFFLGRLDSQDLHPTTTGMMKHDPFEKQFAAALAELAKAVPDLHEAMMGARSQQVARLAIKPVL